jgi:hypothetical protein
MGISREGMVVVVSFINYLPHDEIPLWEMVLIAQEMSGRPEISVKMADSPKKGIGQK